MTNLPDIFLYLDYRQYLTDLYAIIQKSSPGISMRAFARMAGSSSPNYLQLIRDRKLNIGLAEARTLAQKLGLKKKETKFLLTLILFDHAKTHEEKDRYFQEILRRREYKSIKTLTREQYDYFSHWYIPVIRELFTHPEYPGDPAWIGNRIVPSVSPGKVRKGIATLKALHLVELDPASGRWIQNERVISTPSEVLSVAVMRYHKDMLTLAQTALGRFRSHERDIRSITLGLSVEQFAIVKKRLEAVWKELLDFSEQAEKPERVCQLQMSLFPLTKWLTPKGKRQ
jgi:uncharacterized protein (TIGR02147 family)